MKYSYPTLSVICVLSVMWLSGCTVLRETSKYGFNDGIYHTGRFSSSKVYVQHTGGDTIATFPVKKMNDGSNVRAGNIVNFTSVKENGKYGSVSTTFYRPSFDLDIMTMPFKYRPSVNGFPNQLNNNFNGALYSGYRIDAYQLSYRQTPLNVYKQNITHTGYSAGLFLGLGNTAVNSSTLNDPAYTIQYDGVLLLTGAAVNVAVGNLTLGICIGTDHLLDNNRDKWIYQGKLCASLAVGLNLN